MILGTASNLQQMARKEKNQGAAMQQEYARPHAVARTLESSAWMNAKPHWNEATL